MCAAPKATPWWASFSERDVTRGLAEYGANITSLPVATFLKRAVISCTLQDSIVTVLRLMNEHQVRHLPVMVEHNLVGVISANRPHAPLPA